MVPPIFTVAVAYIGDEWPRHEVAGVAGLYMVGRQHRRLHRPLHPGVLTDLIGWRTAFVVLAADHAGARGGTWR